MGLSFFKKLFGNEDGVEAAGGQSNISNADEPSLKNSESSSKKASDRKVDNEYHGAAVTVEGLQDFVKYVVQALVDEPDDVTIDLVEKNQLNVIQVHCAKKDIGKIVGKSGKTIAAIRALVSGAAGRGGLRATVDVLD
ncbi:MAG: KH domain-containing protein [Lentisphaeria bacterium]